MTLKMEINNKSQKSGDNSINIQAESFNLHSGLSISHVRELAMEVFESNFYKMVGIAKETAEERAKEITDLFVKELAARNPNGLKATEDPDFLHSLFIAQREYAKSGERDLGDILVDILVDRTKQQGANLLKIVLNESIAVASMLNSEHLDILACLFNVAYVKSNTIVDLISLKNHIDDNILRFSTSIASKISNYQHLEFARCASIRTGSRNIIQILTSSYPAMFRKGYPRSAIQNLEAADPAIISLHIKNFHDSTLIQAGGMDESVIRTMCETNNISPESTTELVRINESNQMSEQEARTFLCTLCPKFTTFILEIENSRFSSLELTSVGIAIAHAHSRKKAGFDADLSIWI